MKKIIFLSIILMMSNLIYSEEPKGIIVEGEVIPVMPKKTTPHKFKPKKTKQAKEAVTKCITNNCTGELMTCISKPSDIPLAEDRCFLEFSTCTKKNCSKDLGLK